MKSSTYLKIDELELYKDYAKKFDLKDFCASVVGSESNIIDKSFKTKKKKITSEIRPKRKKADR